MKWKYHTKFNIEAHFGFVYQITDTKTGMKYIGSKQFFNKIKRPPLKGKKRIRRDSIESNWLTYNSSSKSLRSVIENYIKLTTPLNPGAFLLRFRFDIVSLHQTRFELSYYENKMIYQYDALLDDRYYNCYASRLGTKKDFK